MNTLAEAIERLEDLGRAGFHVSIGYGPCPEGPSYTVMVMHPAAMQATDFPVAVTDFISAVMTAEEMIKVKGWEDAEPRPRTISRTFLEEIAGPGGSIIRRKPLLEDPE